MVVNFKVSYVNTCIVRCFWLYVAFLGYFNDCLIFRIISFQINIKSKYAKIRI